MLWERLDGHTAAELLPTKRAEVAQVDGDATLMEIAAAMVRARAPLVAVRDRDGRLLGGITTSRLLTPPAGRPMSATLAVAIFLGAYGLIATEKVNRVTVALTGAGLLLALRVVSSADAFHSERYGIDWDVIFLLLGTATLIGDPPNIIIASQADLSYTDFLVNLAPLVVVLMVVFLALSRWLFRAALINRPDRVDELMALDQREALTDRPLLVRCLLVLALVTAAFALHGLHLEPSVVARLGAGLLLLLARRDPEPFLREIEWPTLLFFVGLFVMVGALIKTDVIAQLAEAVATATGGSLWVASMLLLWLSGLLSAIVDSIPYVATMAPVTATLVQDFHGHGDPTVLWWSLALGADLGGNATAIGASANVVILGLAQRAGRPIHFLEFTKYGAVVAIATMLVCVPYLWLRYFALS